MARILSTAILFAVLSFIGSQAMQMAKNAQVKHNEQLATALQAAEEN